MPQTTLNIINEIKITKQGINPDVKINLIEEKLTGIKISVEVDLKRHNFDTDCKVSLQSFDRRGSGFEPFILGSIIDLANDKNEFRYFIPEVNKDEVRFRLLVSKVGEFKKIKVNRIIGRCEINKFFNDENQVDDKKNFKTESLLPTKEQDIGTVFKIEMIPDRKPYLILKSGCNIKYNLDNNIDPIQKTLIYTSAIRELLTNYLIDSRFENCIYKEKWWKLISEKVGESIDDFPKSFLTIDREAVNIEMQTVNWINEVSEIMVSNLLDSSGKKLIAKFIEKNTLNENRYSEETEYGV